MFDIQWKRTFYSFTEEYDTKDKFFLRLIDYDFCDCQAELAPSNIKVDLEHVKLLTQQYPKKKLLDNATWNYHPEVKLPYKLT